MDAMGQLLDAVWLEERAGVLDKLALVEEVALSLLEGPVEAERRDAARRAAHQLVVVGTFGFDKASTALREAEQLLVAPRELTPTDGLVLARTLLAVRPELEAPRAGAAAALPAPEAPEAPEAAEAAAEVTAPGDLPSDDTRQVDVLVVEDDALLVPLLRHALEAQGRTVEVAEDGPTALALLTGDPAAAVVPRLRAGLVLLDIDLPGASGLQVLRRLGSAGVLAGTKVIVLTARSTEAEVLEALELGAVDHVAKPFSLPVLLHRVRLALPG